MEIKAILDLDLTALEILISSSEKEGFNFVSRLKNDWKNNTNRFNKTNEKLYTISINNLLIGIGGINNNPYNEDRNVGRIRHFYILPKYRQKGIGKHFIQFLLEENRMKYETLSLRTDTEIASFWVISKNMGKILPL